MSFESDFDQVVNRPLPRVARKRALEYLARIRKLIVFQFRPLHKEQLLWLVLPICLDCPGPLLPLLQQLEIGHVQGVHMGYLAILLSPTLKTLKVLSVANPPEDKLALLVLDLAKDRGCDLQVFTYRGPPAHRVPEILTSFKTLQVVEIPSCYPKPHSSLITIIEFLAALPYLRSLICNLRTFPPCTTRDTFCHTHLQKIHILSPTRTIREFFRKCTFPAITEVKVEQVNETPGFEAHVANCLAIGLDKSCPVVQTLDLCLHSDFNRDDVLPLNLKHFIPLLSLPMQVFNLSVAKLDLAPSDLRTISDSWPNLRSFSMWSRNDLGIHALPCLVAFSNHTNLTHLDLNLRPHLLLYDIARIPDLIAAHIPPNRTRPNPCTLSFVTINGPEQIPVATKAEKRSLVEYLLLLFPGLILGAKQSHLRSTCSDAQTLAELQDILSELRSERNIGT